MALPNHSLSLNSPIMKIVLLAAILLSCMACEKSTVKITYKGAITPIDTSGAFGPFSKGSTWTYQTTACEVNNPSSCITTTIDYTHDGFYSNYKWETVDIQGISLYVKDGNYYEVINNQLLKTMVEAPIVGLTWKSEVALPDVQGHRSYRRANFAIIAINQSKTVAAGTFNNVVQVERLTFENSTKREQLYYQRGVGLIYKETDFGQGPTSTFELMSYTIL